MLQVIKPLIDCCWGVIQLDAIDECSRSTAYCLGTSILPHSAGVHVCVPLIGIVVIDAGKGCFIKTKLSSNFGCPLGFKFDIRHICLRKNLIQLTVAEVFVLVEKTVALFSTKSLEVWYHLGNLECVDMVRQWEWSICPVYLIGNSSIKPWSLKKFVPDRVLALTVTAHKVDEDFNIDTSAT